MKFEIEYNPDKLKPYSIKFSPSYMTEPGHYLYGDSVYTIESLEKLIKGYYEYIHKLGDKEDE